MEGFAIEELRLAGANICPRPFFKLQKEWIKIIPLEFSKFQALP
jgi:hypothetical protein